MRPEGIGGVAGFSHWLRVGRERRKIKSEAYFSFDGDNILRITYRLLIPSTDLLSPIANKIGELHIKSCIECIYSILQNQHGLPDSVNFIMEIEDDYRTIWKNPELYK